MPHVTQSWYGYVFIGLCSLAVACQSDNSNTPNNSDGTLTQLPGSGTTTGGSTGGGSTTSSTTTGGGHTGTTGGGAVTFINNQSATFSIGDGLTVSNVNGGANGPASPSTATSRLSISTMLQTLFITNWSVGTAAAYIPIPTLSGAFPNFTWGPVSNGSPPVTDSSLSGEVGGTSLDDDTNSLLISDSGNNRVLLYTPLPTSSSMTAASQVLGQPDFDNNNNSNTCSASGLNYPRNAFLVPNGGPIIVPDVGHARVLIWSPRPSQVHGAAANLVLGQPNLTTCNGSSACGDSSNLGNPNIICQPIDTWSDGTRLFIYDVIATVGVSDGNTPARLLVWNEFPSTNGQAADYVLTTALASDGNASLGLGDGAVYSNGSQLFVATGLGNTVLIWNSIPTQDGTAPNVVLGQTPFSQTPPTPGGTSNTFSRPEGLLQVGKQLYVADFNNNRVLVFTGS